MVVAVYSGKNSGGLKILTTNTILEGRREKEKKKEGGGNGEEEGWNIEDFGEIPMGSKVVSRKKREEGKTQK